MTSYVEILVRRAKRWEQLVGNTKNGIAGLKKSAKLERFVQKGIPMKYRGSVWMTISGANAHREKQPDLYNKLLGKRVKPKDVIIEQVFHLYSCSWTVMRR
jgi:hypothetical protein